MMLRLRSVFALAFCVCLGLPAARAVTNQHVILITIDGLADFYLSDPKAPMPVLRQLAAEGAVAEGLRVSNPSVTWPNHTTLVTGAQPARHSVLYNGVIIPPAPGQPVRVDPARDKSDLVAIPTIYDHLHKAGARTADVNWPCTRGAETLDDSFPDVPEQIKHMTPRLRQELTEAGILGEPTDAWFRSRSSAQRDQIWTAAAVHLIKTRRPHFMLFHLLITDGLQHEHGPSTSAAYTALALADAHLGEILRALEEAGIRERTTILIASDHGFERVLKQVHPNVLFREAGLFEPGGEIRAQALSLGGTAMLYFPNPETRDADREKAIALLDGHEGIADIIDPSRYPALGLPDPARNPRMGGLLLSAEPGYSFSSSHSAASAVTEHPAPRGSHGFLAANPKMHGVFIASGYKIKPGQKLGMVDSTAVAPTIARLFGIPFQADGQPLDQIIE